MSVVRLSRNFKVPVVYGSSTGKIKTVYRWDPASKRVVPVQCQCASIPPEVSGLGEYSWLLIDNSNVLWTADADFSNLRQTNYTIPLGTGYWGYGPKQKTLWTGSYWLFGDKTSENILRSDANLNGWEISSGITFNFDGYDLATNGSNSVVLISRVGGIPSISSNNGLTWTTLPAITALTNDYHYKTYYDGTVWLVTLISAAGFSRIYRSTDNGLTWNIVLGVSSPDQILCICRLSNGTFYVTGRLRYWTSPDGITWSQFNMGTGVTSNLIGEILHDGTKFVGIGLYDGPIWSNDGVNWTKWTSTDGSVLNGYDYDYNRLHYNGTAYAFRNGTNNILHTSLNGKTWSRLTHPRFGRWFIDAYPKAQDVNLNIK